MKAVVKRLVKSVFERGATPAPINDRMPEGRHAQDHFLRPGYHARSAPQYFEDFTPAGEPRVYQPDVYSLADALASAGSRRVVDIGCGKAGKLRRLAEHHDITGVDIGINIEFCRKEHAFGRWIEHDIESPDPLPLHDVDLNHVIVICADVIEHVVDPYRLLGKLKTCTDRGALVLLSTPERDLVRGHADPGPPQNPAHVREWAIAELRALLLHAGFDIPYLGLTVNDHVRREMSTILAVLQHRPPS